MNPYRSILFVPGHKPEWIAKAAGTKPDAIVLDLEDSVPDNLKIETRKTVGQSLEKMGREYPTIDFLVRVNSLESGMMDADLDACMGTGLSGLFIPKIETVDDLAIIDSLIDKYESMRGLSGTQYIVPIETVAAIWNAREIANGSPRVGAMIGPTAEHADIAREVGFEWTPEGLETLYLRSRVLLACREARIHALTGLWEKIDDLPGLEQFARGGRQLGFRGMIVIHPTHVKVVNNVFTPTDADIEFYQGQVDAYEKAASEGHGALRYRGLHIDKAHYDKAVQWLERAQDLRKKDMET